MTKMIVPQSLPATPPLPDDAGVYAFPMTPQQARMWHAVQAQPGLAIYNGAFRWEINGQLDATVLAQAFERLAARHEGLRAVCRDVGGKPMLIVAAHGSIRLAVEDLSWIPDGQRDSEVDRRCLKEARTGFDLVHGPLARARLYRLERERHLLALTVHQVICDGWSIGLLSGELTAAYTALAGGTSPVLPELAIQLGDYLVWHDDQLTVPETADQVRYWQKKLEGYRRFDVPPDRVPIARGTTTSDIIARALPTAVTKKLSKVSGDLGGTMFAASASALAATLWRQTGRRDVSFGIPLANRRRQELETLFGPTLNCAILTAHVEPGDTYASLEARVRASLHEAIAHADVPLEVLGLRLGAASLPDPPFSVMFTCQRAFAGPNTLVHDMNGASLRTLPSKSQGALHDLYIFLIERETGWRLSIEYKTDLFSEARVKSILDDIEQSLATFASDPTVDLSGRTAPDTTPAAAAPSAVSSKAATARDAADGSVPPPPTTPTGDVVAIPASITQGRYWLLHRAGMADAAFNLPAYVRIKGALSVGLLRQSLAHAVGLHEALRTTFHEQDGELLQVIAPAVDLELERSTVQGSTPAEQEHSVQALLAEEAAKPFDLANRPGVRARLFEISDQEHVLAITLHHAVADGHSVGLLMRAIWESYDALSAGSTTLPQGPQLHFGDYAAWQREWLDSPEAGRQLAYWQDKLKGPLPVANFPIRQRSGSAEGPGAAVASISLPAEVSTGLFALARSEGTTPFVLTATAFAVLLGQFAGADGDVIFGCPNANRRDDTATVVGPFAAPLPIRVILGTCKTFSDAFRAMHTTVMDATGNADYPFDEVYRQIDVRSVGGRTPLFQFHFTYQRAFLQDQKARALAVSPIPVPLGSPYEFQIALIERPGFVEMKCDYDPRRVAPVVVEAALAAYLSILQAMVADISAPLAKLVDGAALAATSAGDRSSPPPYQAPRNRVETVLVELFERVLKRPDIGVHDNFFDAGGQSILAAELVALIAAELRLSINISQLANAASVEALAQVLANPDSSVRSPTLVEFQPAGSKPPMFCIHGVGGHILHFMSLAAGLSKSQPLYALAAPELDGGAISNYRELARFHAEQVRAVRPRGPYRICGYSAGAFVAVELASILSDADGQMPCVILLDMPNPAAYKTMSFANKVRFEVLKKQDELASRLRGQSFRKVMSSAAKRSSRLWRNLQTKPMSAAPVVPPSPQDRQLTHLTTLMRTYSPTPFDGSIILFRSESEAHFDVDPTLGWGSIARRGVAVVRVPGDHLTMLREPNVLNIINFLDQI